MADQQADLAESLVFDAALAERFEQLGDSELLLSLQEAYQALYSRRRDLIHYGDADRLSETQRARRNCEVISQAALHRAERLMAACFTMVAERNVYGIALVIRGHLEATAAIGFLCNRVASYVDSNIAFEAVVWDIARILMGARHSQFKNAPEPISILTCFEKADRYYEKKHTIGRKRMLQDSYEWLCEFAHPNFNSNVSAFEREGDAFRMRHDRELSADELKLVGYLDISGHLLTELFDDLDHIATDAFPE